MHSDQPHAKVIINFPISFQNRHMQARFGRPVCSGDGNTNDAIETFYDELESLEDQFYWWWHKAQRDIGAVDDLIGLAESLLERSAKSRVLSIRDKRWICRAAFMIHEMCLCFDGSGSREKLPY